MRPMVRKVHAYMNKNTPLPLGGVQGGVQDVGARARVSPWRATRARAPANSPTLVSTPRSSPRRRSRPSRRRYRHHPRSLSPTSPPTRPRSRSPRSAAAAAASTLARGKPQLNLSSSPSPSPGSPRSRARSLSNDSIVRARPQSARVIVIVSLLAPFSFIHHDARVHACVHASRLSPSSSRAPSCPRTRARPPSPLLSTSR